MKSLWIWFLLVTMFVGGCSGCSRTSFKRVFEPRLTMAETLQQETVALYRVDEDGDAMTYCAGTWIDKTHILTAAHCVAHPEPETENLIKNDDDLSVVNPVGSEVEYAVFDDFKTQPYVPASTFRGKRAKIIDYDSRIDLALLKTSTEAPVHPWAWVSRDLIHTGDPISTVGHTVSFTWTYTRGTISMVRETQSFSSSQFLPKVKLMQIAASLWFGNSGGSVFNDEGHIIGVASFIVQRGPNIGFAIHRDVILDFLAKNRVLKP